MSIQRYGPVWTGDESCSIAGNATGEYVLYADHVAAMREAQHVGRLYLIRHYNDGVQAERARIYQAVEALIDDGKEYQAVMLRNVLSIIDGEDM